MPAKPEGKFFIALDPRVATAALIDALGAQTPAKAAAYTAGKHWLLLWNLVVTGVATWAIVRSGVLDRVEARLARRGVNARAFVVGVIFFLVTDRLFPRFARAFGSPVPISDPRPHPLQEIIFYTHPAVQRRVLEAMQWNAAGHAAPLPARQR